MAEMFNLNELLQVRSNQPVLCQNNCTMACKMVIRLAVNYPSLHRGNIHLRPILAVWIAFIPNEQFLVCLATMTQATPIDLVNIVYTSCHLWPRPLLLLSSFHSTSRKCSWSAPPSVRLIHWLARTQQFSSQHCQQPCKTWFKYFLKIVRVFAYACIRQIDGTVERNKTGVRPMAPASFVIVTIFLAPQRGRFSFFFLFPPLRSTN